MGLGLSLLIIVGASTLIGTIVAVNVAVNVATAASNLLFSLPTPLLLAGAAIMTCPSETSFDLHFECTRLYHESSWRTTKQVSGLLSHTDSVEFFNAAGLFQIATADFWSVHNSGKEKLRWLGCLGMWFPLFSLDGFNGVERQVCKNSRFTK